MDRPRRPHALFFAFPLAIAILSLPSLSIAASLDDLYGQLVPPGRLLSETRFDSFRMLEKGIHGSASFAGFKSRPAVDSLGEELRLPLSARTELSVGYVQGFNDSYQRPTMNNADEVASLQRYHIDQNLTGNIGMRFRSDENEYFISALRKRTETDWNFASSDSSLPIYFNYFHSRYVDLRAGVKTLSPSGQHRGTGLDLYDRPLLDAGQAGWELESGLRSGRLTRDGVYYVANRYNYEYSFRTTGHAASTARYRRGLSDRTELDAGLTWESPFKYKFTYGYNRLLGTNYFVFGTYSFRQWFEAPFALRVRPSPELELRPGVTFRYVDQKLEYWQKKEDNTEAYYPEKKLDYYGITPSLKVSYLVGKENAVPVKPVYDFNQKHLAKGQWAFEAEWSKQIDVLDRAHGTGGFNLADPYEEYLHPAANYVSGTEYAAFLSGNSGSTPADVRPENSHEIKGKATVGLNDRLSLGLGAGYRTSATAHQFSLGDLSERFFKFKPVYFFDGSLDWQFRENALLTVDTHFVPAYETIMISSANPEEYKATTRYVVALVKLKFLF